MKQIIILLFSCCLCSSNYAQTNTVNTKNKTAMKLNAGIITNKIAETKKFYTETLGFGITFENEFYLLMHTPDKSAELSFLLPNHPTQQPLFQKPFNGEGVYLTIEVEDVDKLYQQLKKKNVQKRYLISFCRGWAIPIR